MLATGAAETPVHLGFGVAVWTVGEKIFNPLVIAPVADLAPPDEQCR